MAAPKKDTKDSSAEVKAELEKTRKALAEALEQIEKLKEKETGKPAVQPKEKTIKDGHEYVDLGLPSGLKWATCNVGASKPEDFGNYYAWGETSTKTEYMEDNSKTYGKSMLDIAGNSNYDAARANWGGTWRMPTKSEMQELINKCNWEWTTHNGVKGYKVTGPNGNSIFLPAAGIRLGSSVDDAGSFGSYWSSTPNEDITDEAYYVLPFNSDEYCMDYCYYSNVGGSVRPVLE